MGNKKRIKPQKPSAPGRQKRPLPERNANLTDQMAQATSPANRARVRDYIRQCDGSPVVAAKGVFIAFAEAAEQVPTGGLKLACRPGCWFCCTIPVAATVFEASLVYGAIQRLPQTDQERIWARLREHVEAQRAALAASPAEPVPFGRHCPLLADDGTCSVYDARPMTCRGLLSLDAERCWRAYLEDDNGDPRQPFLVSNLAADAALPQLMVTLNEGGLDHYANYELASALYALWREPERFLSWQRGQPFAVDGWPLMAEEAKIFRTPPNLPIGREGQR